MAKESKIVTPTGAIDGVNRDFVVSSAYQAGSPRVFINGIAYEANDANYGWAELNDTTIRMDSAPLSGDTVQVFYQEKQGEQVSGSPFHPSGALP